MYLKRGIKSTKKIHKERKRHLSDCTLILVNDKLVHFYRFYQGTEQCQKTLAVANYQTLYP